MSGEFIVTQGNTSKVLDLGKKAFYNMPLLVVNEIAESGIAFIEFLWNTEIGITVCYVFPEGIVGKSFIGKYCRTRDINLIQHTGCHGIIMNLSISKSERKTMNYPNHQRKRQS